MGPSRGAHSERSDLIPVWEIGNKLRETRIRKGLTIRDVEDATKIRARYLEALEADDYETIPGPVYVKAFLRTYASFLGLDADELVAIYSAGAEREQNSRSSARERLPRRSRGPSEGQRRATTKRRRSQRGYFAVGIIAVIAVALLAWFGSSGGGNEATPLENATFSAASTVPPQGVNTTASSTVSSTGTSLPSSTAPTGKNVVLVITVTEGNCWMIVREDNESGAELYAGTLSAGGQNTFDSAKSYWLHVGRPEALALTINGNPVSLQPDEHFYLVTESGAKPAQ